MRRHAVTVLFWALALGLSSASDGGRNELILSAIEAENRGDHARAAALYQEIVESSPDAALPWMRLTFVLNDHLGDYEGAVEAGTRAVAVDRRNAPAWAGWAVALSNAGRHGEALRTLRQAIRMQPYYAWARQRLDTVAPPVRDTLSD